MNIYKASIPKGAEEFLHAINFMMDPSLTNKEIEVLARILNYNMEYRALPTEKRIAYILSSTVKSEIKKELSMKPSNLSNIMKSLKTKSYNGQQVLSSKGLNPGLDLKEIPNSIMIELVEYDGQSETSVENSQETQPEERPSRDAIETSGPMGEEPHATGGQGDSDPELWKVSIIPGAGAQEEAISKG